MRQLQQGNPKYQYELIYKRDFLDNEDHTFIFSATGNLFTKEQSSSFENKTVFGKSTFNNQKTKTDFGQINHTIKIDYVKPFSDKWEIETGAQFTDNDMSNDFEVQDQLDGLFVTNQGLLMFLILDKKSLDYMEQDHLNPINGE